MICCVKLYVFRKYIMGDVEIGPGSETGIGSY